MWPWENSTQNYLQEMAMINFENLNKLADFLETLPSEKFDLFSFRADSDGKPQPFESIQNCGTVGCALGWAPFCGRTRGRVY